MVTKGIVEEIITPYQIKVRLPIFDGAKNTKYSVTNEELALSTICSISGSSNQVNVGDVVFVAFEDNDMGKPIIIGQLYAENINTTLLNLNIGALTTNSITTLNKNTWIGEINPEEIKCLKDVNGNIQLQFNDIREQFKVITNMQNTIDELKEQIEELKNKNGG